jgi:hypothetical protein
MILINSEKTAQWKKCDVNNLVANFCRFTGEGSQYERLGALYLQDDDVAILFPERSEKNPSPIESFAIKFALDTNVAGMGEFNFRPFISVRQTGVTSPAESPFCFEHEYKKTNVSPRNAAEVPPEFKDVVTQNWIDLDVSLIDDVFTASLPDTSFKKNGPRIPPKRVPQRLLAYQFKNGSNPGDQANPTFLDFINKHSGQIRTFAFHLGIDMNKFPHKDQFTFSPVIELTVETITPAERGRLLETIHQNGLRACPVKGAADLATVYYEYMAPCPSTCGNE